MYRRCSLENELQHKVFAIEIQENVEQLQSHCTQLGGEGGRGGEGETVNGVNINHHTILTVPLVSAPPTLWLLEAMFSMSEAMTDRSSWRPVTRCCRNSLISATLVMEERKRVR